MIPPRRLILASASPRRREILGRMGVSFDVVTASVTEHEEPTTDPRLMVAHNAALKADWVARRHPDALVLGADTTVSIDGRTLNKPADLDDARRMLRLLAGRTHCVFTGIAIRGAADGRSIDEVATSDVVFRPLDDAAIERYLAKVHVLDKAGAYAIQDEGASIVASYSGSLSNIMGLPEELTKQLLTRCGLLR